MKTRKDQNGKSEKKAPGISEYKTTGILLIDLGFLLHCASRFNTNSLRRGKRQ
ncbi:MAG: hypothetical protein H6757_00705 [Candidatus Omnitrophica bacterium]|nr:hypothetical protein [Candidatus Omnitrophota bacterium]